MSGTTVGNLKVEVRCTFLTRRIVSDCNNGHKGPCEFCLLKVFFSLTQPGFVSRTSNSSKTHERVALGRRSAQVRLEFIRIFPLRNNNPCLPPSKGTWDAALEPVLHSPVLLSTVLQGSGPPAPSPRSSRAERQQRLPRTLR